VVNECPTLTPYMQNMISVESLPYVWPAKVKTQHIPQFEKVELTPESFL